MSPLQPTFTLSAGSVRSTSTAPVAGPRALLVERDLDVPADAAELHVSERSGIEVGDSVTIALGHDGGEELVFTGRVAVLRPALSGVVIHCLGMMNDLLNLRLGASYENQTAGAIARDLIGRAGLAAATVDEGPLLPRYAVDYRLSAYAHLKELADRLGYELSTGRDGRVRFQALGPAAGLDAAGGILGAAAGALSAVAGLTTGEGYAFGQHLIGAAAHRAPAAWGEIVVGGESPMSGQGDATAHWLSINDADYRGSAGSGAPRRLVLDPAARTKDLADRFAAGHLAVATRRADNVWVTVLGRPGVELGDSITVSDVPDGVLNGAGYVRAIRHRLGEVLGFLSDLRVSREAS